MYGAFPVVEQEPREFRVNWEDDQLLKLNLRVAFWIILAYATGADYLTNKQF